MLLVTAVFFLLRQIKMSAVRKSYRSRLTSTFMFLKPRMNHVHYTLIRQHYVLLMVILCWSPFAVKQQPHTQQPVLLCVF